MHRTRRHRSTGHADPRHPIGIRQHHRGCSPQSRALAAGCRLIVKNAVRAWALVPDLHWPFESIDRLAALAPPPPSASVQPVLLPHCPAELVCASGVSTRRAILYLHGGALLTCGLNTHRVLAARLSRAAEAAVLNVGYRLLPAFAPHCAVADALDGLRWLKERGYADDCIVLAGDSAGGYLALQTALELLRRGRTPTAGVATISPLTDLNPNRKILHRNAVRCSMFTGKAVSLFSRYVTEHRGAGSTPQDIVSPVDADLSRMPPVSVHVSTDELLLPDAELLFQRMLAAGAQCELHLWDGQIHDFPLAADFVPEGRRAINYLGDFVKRVTPAPGRSVDAPELPGAA